MIGDAISLLVVYAGYAYAASRTGSRLAPQSPGVLSNTPAQRVPHSRQAPSSVRFQPVNTYQSRPIKSAPQA